MTVAQEALEGMLLVGFVTTLAGAESRADRWPWSEPEYYERPSIVLGQIGEQMAETVRALQRG